jgi:hypothetical protein
MSVLSAWSLVDPYWHCFLFSFLPFSSEEEQILEELFDVDAGFSRKLSEGGESQILDFLGGDIELKTLSSRTFLLPMMRLRVDLALT